MKKLTNYIQEGLKVNSKSKFVDWKNEFDKLENMVVEMFRKYSLTWHPSFDLEPLLNDEDLFSEESTNILADLVDYSKETQNEIPQKIKDELFKYPKIDKFYKDQIDSCLRRAITKRVAEDG